MILGYFTNKPLCLGPRYWGRFSGFNFITGKSSAQKFFLVAAIYEHLVGGLVKTLYSRVVVDLRGGRLTSELISLSVGSE